MVREGEGPSVPIAPGVSPKESINSSRCSAHSSGKPPSRPSELQLRRLPPVVACWPPGGRGKSRNQPMHSKSRPERQQADNGRRGCLSLWASVHCGVRRHPPMPHETTASNGLENR